MRSKDERKIERIYNASLELISENGMAGLVMSKLAKKAGLATGTLYIYFKNKEELLHQLYLKLRKESQQRFMKGYDPETPFKAGIKQVWINYLKHRIHHYRESVFLEQYYRSPYITEEHKRMAEAMKQPVHHIIQRGKNEGLIKTQYDNEMIFLSLIGFIRELADEHVTKVYRLTEKKIQQAFELSWDTIKI